jgi:uncharacterized protein with HEPN domain
MRREELYLADLIDNARAVRGYLDGVTRERWDAEDILRDAVLYRMLLLGEIASALPDELRDRYPDVAWRQVRAFRNLAVHKYFGVDWAVVWKIAQEEPTVLEAQVLAIIRAEYPALAKDYEARPAPDPGTASLRDQGRWRFFLSSGFPTWMIESLDREARRLGVNRQSIIKVWIAGRLERDTSPA